jgi:hypothetical protein
MSRYARLVNTSQLHSLLSASNSSLTSMKHDGPAIHSICSVSVCLHTACCVKMNSMGGKCNMCSVVAWLPSCHYDMPVHRPWGAGAPVRGGSVDRPIRPHRGRTNPTQGGGVCLLHVSCAGAVLCVLG